MACARHGMPRSCMRMRIDLDPGPARTRRTRATTAVFVDKDGTLLEDVPFNVDPARVRFAPRALEGLRLLGDAGHALIVVSNQSGIALGHFGVPALQRLARAVQAALARQGIVLDGFYACPHAPGADGRPTCACRKPRDGLLRVAAREHRIQLDRSWMVGDILDDVEAGHAAGCRSVLLDVGHETEWRLGAARTPDVITTDLETAARAILRRLA